VNHLKGAVKHAVAIAATPVTYKHSLFIKSTHVCHTINFLN
jgi:hypothetical protein